MGIKISDALGHITDRKPLSSKAIKSLERQLIGCQSKIKRATDKIGQINWILKKNDGLIQELKQLSEVQEEGAESFVLLNLEKKINNDT